MQLSCFPETKFQLHCTYSLHSGTKNTTGEKPRPPAARAGSRHHQQETAATDGRVTCCGDPLLQLSLSPSSANVWNERVSARERESFRATATLAGARAVVTVHWGDGRLVFKSVEWAGTKTKTKILGKKSSGTRNLEPVSSADIRRSRVRLRVSPESVEEVENWMERSASNVTSHYSQ